MKKFLKGKFVLVLSITMVLTMLFVGKAFANGGTTHVVSSPLNYSSTGWGGWSCPTGMVVVNAGIQGNTYPVGESVIWRPGATTAGGVSYPNTPFGYNYTPPEEGYIVQNGGISQTLQIWLDCAPAPEVLPEYICHATGSSTNPFVANTPSNIGQLMGHVGPGHQEGRDIIPPIPVFLPSGQNWDTVGQAIWENGCEVPEPHDYELVFDQRNECLGQNYYRIMLTDFGKYVSTLYHSGFFAWSDPYTLESKTFGPFDLGEFGTFPAVTLEEPANCQIFRTYKHHQAYLANNCEGIRRVINLYEGPASDPYKTLVGTFYNQTVLFTDPFNLETIPAVTVDVPDAYGPDYTFAAMDEPETCYSTCDVTTPVVQDPVWGNWTPWVYNPGNGLEESTRTGTQTTLFMDSVNEKYVCGSSVEELSDYRSREVDYSLTVTGTGDCSTWEYVVNFTEGGVMSVEGDLKGSWVDIYGPEIAPVPTVSVVWPSGYALTVTPAAFAKDNGCIQCRITPYYPQASYLDAAAPDVYWQGPFNLGPGVCSVIHPEGQVPSSDRVRTICSLCPDVYEGGYVYQVNHMFYDGWVYKVQCYGEEPHYTYMGYNWDAYVRIGEYTTEGERLSCRVQGCADWIHENAE